VDVLQEINDAIEMSNATTHTSDGVYRSELVDLYSINLISTCGAIKISTATWSDTQ
jgi:hypothetical protein